MADTVSGNLSTSVNWSWQSPQADGTTPKDSGSLAVSQNFASGSGTGQVSKVWHQTLTAIASSGHTDLDLTGLTNTIFGATVTTNFGKVLLIQIINNSTTSGEDLKIDTTQTNAWFGTAQPFGASTDTIKIPAGGTLILENPVAGFTVDSTHKVFRINNLGAANNTPTIVILGQ